MSDRVVRTEGNRIVLTVPTEMRVSAINLVCTPTGTWEATVQLMSNTPEYAPAVTADLTPADVTTLHTIIKEVLFRGTLE